LCEPHTRPPTPRAATGKCGSTTQTGGTKSGCSTDNKHARRCGRMPDDKAGASGGRWRPLTRGGGGKPGGFPPHLLLNASDLLLALCQLRALRPLLALDVLFNALRPLTSHNDKHPLAPRRVPPQSQRQNEKSSGVIRTPRTWSGWRLRTRSFPNTGNNRSPLQRLTALEAILSRESMSISCPNLSRCRSAAIVFHSAICEEVTTPIPPFSREATTPQALQSPFPSKFGSAPPEANGGNENQMKRRVETTRVLNVHVTPRRWQHDSRRTPTQPN